MNDFSKYEKLRTLINQLTYSKPTIHLFAAIKLLVYKLDEYLSNDLGHFISYERMKYHYDELKIKKSDIEKIYSKALDPDDTDYKFHLYSELLQYCKCESRGLDKFFTTDNLISLQLMYGPNKTKEIVDILSDTKRYLKRKQTESFEKHDKKVTKKIPTLDEKKLDNLMPEGELVGVEAKYDLEKKDKTPEFDKLVDQLINHEYLESHKGCEFTHRKTMKHGVFELKWMGSDYPVDKDIENFTENTTAGGINESKLSATER